MRSSAIAIVAAIVVSGCSDGGANPLIVAPLPCYPAAGDDTCPDEQVQDDFPALYVEGELVVRHGCVYVGIANADPQAIVFPYGTRWDGDAGQVLGPDGAARIGEGDRFQGIGAIEWRIDEIPAGRFEAVIERLEECMAFDDVDRARFTEVARSGILHTLP